MLIKKISLNNIRSYKGAEIEFPPGSVLLSGDVGSGKTSVLLAIEFALFGLQPGQRGSSLLRSNEKEGGVKIEVEIEGKEIIIERTLKRGKSIGQEYCAITIDGEKKETSITELKSFVLDLLNYPKEFAKKQNLLYKFTVYTPQEEMKQIILQDSETRMDTLRHVFGVDKYKKILENVSILTSKIKEEKRKKEGVIEDLEQSKSSLLLKEKEVDDKGKILFIMEKEFFDKTEKRIKIQKEKEELSKKIEEKRKYEQEIEKTHIMLINKRETIANNTKIINSLKKQIEEASLGIFDEGEIKKTEAEINFKKNERELLNKKNLLINSKINSLKLKNEENVIIKKKISSIDICPTCLQNVDAVYKANVINKIEGDTSDSEKEIKKLVEEESAVSKKTRKLEEEISSLEKNISELKLLKIKIKNLEEKKKQIEEANKDNLALEKDLDLLNEHMQALKETVLDFGRFDNFFILKQQELDDALRDEKIVEIKLVELKKEIDLFSKQIVEMKEQILRKEETKSQLNYLIELESWLSQKFVPLIYFVEKNVMIKLRKEFSNLFNEWFCMLVSDNFIISLDENFTPIIEQQDYELDYSYLSGGERTAIALAYRLALNQVINSMLSKIKTRDLVILDEPTDGFSEQQLDKMRDVLQQLNVGQLILVSHEQKIENFVENIIRFKKDQGITQVEV